MGPIVNKLPILLTSSVVAMDTSVELRDQNLRISYTLESLNEWMRIAPKNKFVICDGSGYDFSHLVKESFPNANIECLFFKNQIDMVRLHGKGYGEGEIILYALANSTYLNDAPCFAKCTAKLWVDNYQKCALEWNGKFLCKAYFSNVFSWKPLKLEYIDTRFYLINKNIYMNYFANAHLLTNSSNKVVIEEEFLKIALKEKLSHIVFRNPPVICGVGGGSGLYYKNSRLRRAKEILRSKIASANSKFQFLFNH
ncbi:MAG: hypothetical protein B7X60_04825 [Polynucleobacter sp. 39-45-136]|jgi:hypothetical protein|nr:MAG: hypothetical protein B7X60_04825 [Polynucleobacter sp. 39-45-136]